MENINRKFKGKVLDDLRFVLICFKEVLSELGEEDLAQNIPFINNNFSTTDLTVKHIQLYSLIFNILNLVEVNSAVQYRRCKENINILPNGLLAQKLQKLKSLGFSESEIAKELDSILIEPVLTAHPTECKRITILEHHRALYLLLVKRENCMYSVVEQEQIRNEIKNLLEILWLTGEIYLEKPNVEAELKNIIHYLTEVFPLVMPILDRKLEYSWKLAGFNSELISSIENRPKISFGNWVGGDRDGHPLVTPELTFKTLNELRNNALKIVETSLLDTAKKMSFSISINQVDVDLRNRILQMINLSENKGEAAFNKNKEEVFRQFINLCIEFIPNEHNADYCYKNSDELKNDLALLRNSMSKIGLKRTAFSFVNDIIRIVDTFGFNLAKLDIRQNSGLHDKAIDQIIESTKLNIGKYSELDEQQKIDFLNSEFKLNKKLICSSIKLSPDADNVISTYNVVSNHIIKYGINSIGGLIVSMTRSVSDLLLINLFARETGLTVFTEKGLCNKLNVVPLFETIDDLNNSVNIMDKYLSLPITKHSLEYQRQINNGKELVQMVMVGYSDSNKSGGILASQWSLYKAQSLLVKIGKKHGVRLRFFHGRGGSVSRGAGPANWFIPALPHSSLNGDLRITEQGETIEQKYANKINAAYNIELMVAGAIETKVFQKNSCSEEFNLFEVFEWMKDISYKHYTELINHKYFINFFGEATPIDVIESSKIGSRPVRRTGKRTFDDLRAIPWVFSWTQSRCNMTSWYGVGYTLERLEKERPDDFNKIKENISSDPFLRYIFTNIENSIDLVDEEVFKMYIDLVADNDVKKEISTLILTELERTKTMFNKLDDEVFSIKRKKRLEHISLRMNLLKSLNINQVLLLKEWRSLKAENGSPEKQEEVLVKLLFSINAIAGGLGTTG